jgi:hypothetical protein
MKDLASPTVTPGLDHPCTFPVQCIGEEKSGGITQILLFMPNHQSSAAIAFEPNSLGKCPALLKLSVAATHLQMTKALWMLSAWLRSNTIDSTPLPIPKNQAGTLNLAHPVFATGFNYLRQFQGQDPVVYTDQGNHLTLSDFDSFRVVRLLPIVFLCL